MRKLIKLFKKEPVFVLSFILAIFTCFLNPPSLKYISYIDFKVIFGLFSLMIIISGFSKNKLFNVLSNLFLSRCKNSRASYIALMGITFFTSMFITNDVALITFIPFTILILDKTNNKKNAIFFIAMQTVSANIGSSLMPTGNPQNLFLYFKYNYNYVSFIIAVLPVVLIGGIIIIVGLLCIKKDRFNLNLAEEKIKNPLHVVIYVIFFIITLLGIFNLIPFYIPLILIIFSVILIDKSILKEADYILLTTFMCFFIFIGNLSSVEAIKNLFKILFTGELNVYLTALGLSQIISNVPAAILISGFTDYANALLLGVSVGGCGTLIASLASLISYKYFQKAYPQNTFKYLTIYSIINIIFIIILSIPVIIQLIIV